MSGVFGDEGPSGPGERPRGRAGRQWQRAVVTYETVAGFPVVYDDALGLFCYASVVQGSYQSTAVPVSAPPPPHLPLHAREADDVRAEKIRRR